MIAVWECCTYSGVWHYFLNELIWGLLLCKEMMWENLHYFMWLGAGIMTGPHKNGEELKDAITVRSLSAWATSSVYCREELCFMDLSNYEIRDRMRIAW